MKRFTQPVNNLTSVHDRAEGQSYHLASQQEAMRLVELLNMMHEQLGVNIVSAETSNTGDHNP